MMDATSLDGTVLIGVQCEKYIILAADRQCHHQNNAISVADWQTRKITTHPRLPLAIANGGYALMESGKESVSQWIASQFSAIGDSLEPDEVFSIIVDRLWPRVVERRKISRESGASPMHVTLYAGLASNGSAVLKSAKILDNEPRIEEVPACLNSSSHLTAFYQELLDNHEDFWGRNSANIPTHAARLREIIKAGVAQEAVLRPGLPPTVGREADVVVVDLVGHLEF